MIGQVDPQAVLDAVELSGGGALGGTPMLLMVGAVVAMILKDVFAFVAKMRNDSPEAVLTNLLAGRIDEMEKVQAEMAHQVKAMYDRHRDQVRDVLRKDRE